MAERMSDRSTCSSQPACDVRDRTMRDTARSARQIAVEATARAQAKARRIAGLCSKDVYDGFNSRRGCLLDAGHAGGCA